MKEFWIAVLPALGVLAGLGAKAFIDVLLERRRWDREDRLRDRDEKRRTYRRAFELLMSLSHDRLALDDDDASDAERLAHRKTRFDANEVLVDLQFLAPSAVSAAYFAALQRITKAPPGEDLKADGIDAFLAQCRLDLGARRKRDRHAVTRDA